MCFGTRLKDLTAFQAVISHAVQQAESFFSLLFTCILPFTHSFPSRKRKADSEELTALKRPKLARRGRNRGKKENLEQLYLVSELFCR